MTTFLIVGKTPTNPLFIDYVTAADLAAAEAIVLQRFASGIGVNADGTVDPIILGLLELDATGQITPNLQNPQNAVGVATNNYRWQTQSKAADTVITNSAVLASDPDLQFQMQANTKYRLQGCVIIDTTAAADFQYRLIGPASPTGVRLQRTDAIAGAVPAMRALDVAAPAAQAMVGTGTLGGFVQFEGVWWNGPNAGPFAFQFAQNTQTNDSGVVARAGSWLEFAVA